MNINDGNVMVVSTAVLTEEEKDTLKKRRISGLRKLGSCSFLIAIVSVVSIGIGIGCIAGFANEGKVPYVIGAALISGCMTLLAATFGILAYREGLAQEKATSDFNIDAGFSVKCKIILGYVIHVLNLTFLVFSAGSGVIGIILCSKDDPNCKEDSDAKLALSVLTLIVGVILFIFTLICTIWFCVYARIFGFQGRHGDGTMQLQMMRMQMQLDRQQQQINTQQEEIQQYHQQNRGFSNFSYS